MKATINNKKYSIKPADQLTVKEYVDFWTKLSDKASEIEVLICYLSSVTGLDYDHVADININKASIRRLLAWIGTIKQTTEMPVSTEFYHKRTGKVLYQKSLNWRTLGARKLLEDRKANTQIEQAVYLLAVYVSDGYDSDKVSEIYEELQDYNAIDVLSFVIFFFKKLMIGGK
jgi:hypothetical protein